MNESKWKLWLSSSLWCFVCWRSAKCSESTHSSELRDACLISISTPNVSFWSTLFALRSSFTRIYYVPPPHEGGFNKNYLYAPNHIYGCLSLQHSLQFLCLISSIMSTGSCFDRLSRSFASIFPAWSWLSAGPASFRCAQTTWQPGCWEFASSLDLVFFIVFFVRSKQPFPQFGFSLMFSLSTLRIANLYST